MVLAPCTTGCDIVSQWGGNQNKTNQNRTNNQVWPGNSQSMRVSPRKGWPLGSHSKGLYFCKKNRFRGENTTVLSHSWKLEVRQTDAGPTKRGCVMAHRDGGFRKCYPKIWLEETRPWHPRANCMGYLESAVFTADPIVALKSWLSVKGNGPWRKSTVGGACVRRKSTTVASSLATWQPSHCRTFLPSHKRFLYPIAIPNPPPFSSSGCPRSFYHLTLRPVFCLVEFWYTDTQLTWLFPC